MRGAIAYRLNRAKLPTRKTFFDDVRTLLRYIPFESREALLDFMMRGLEIGPTCPPEPRRRQAHPKRSDRDPRA